MRVSAISTDCRGRPASAGRRFAAVSALLFALLLATCAEEDTIAPARAPEAGDRLDADFGEPIGEWIFSVADNLQELFLPVQQEIIRRAPPDVKFRILCSSDRSRDLVTKAVAADRRRSPDSVVVDRLSAETPWWVRDSFLMGEDLAGGPLYLVSLPEHFRIMQRASRGSASTSWATVARLAGSRRVETRLRLEGGSVVADDTRAFLPLMYAKEAVAAGEFPDVEAYGRYASRVFGKQVVLLPVVDDIPAQHADMFLTPLPGKRMLLADLREGTNIFLAAGLAECRALQARIRPIRAKILGCRESELPATLPPREFLMSGKRFARTCQALDDTEVLLRRLGYQVDRIPWLKLESTGIGCPFYLSWNNVIQDRRDGRDIVYLPQYGHGAMDRVARSIWSGLGYRVEPIPALGPALLGGSIRCLSQVVRIPAPRGS